MPAPFYVWATDSGVTGSFAGSGNVFGGRRDGIETSPDGDIDNNPSGTTAELGYTGAPSVSGIYGLRTLVFSDGGTAVWGAGSAGGFVIPTNEIAYTTLNNGTAFSVTSQTSVSSAAYSTFSTGPAAPVNTAPALGGTPPDANVNEDVTSAVNLSAYNLTDAEGDTVTLTLAVNKGTIASTDGNGPASSVTVAGSGTTSMTLTGAVADLNAYLNITTKITFTTGQNDTSSATLTVTPNDGTINGTADTVTINVTPINDEPTLTATGLNPNANEQTATDLFSTVTADTVETGQTLTGLTLTVTNVSDGSSERLNIDGTAVVLTNGTSGTTATNSMSYSVSVTGSTATVTLSGGTLSEAAMQTLVDGMTYTNNSNAPTTGASRVVTITSLTDSGSNTGLNDNAAALNLASTVTVVAVNDAPTVNSGTATLPGTDEDTTSSGTAVSTLLSNRGFSDPDGSGQQGMAVTGTTGNGTWEFSTDVFNYSPFGAVSDTSSLLLSSSTLVRYVPDGDNGETATLTFRGWDRSSGTASISATTYKVDTTTNGGSTAFSSNTATASITVTDVNDAPTLAATGQNPSANEGQSTDLFSTVSADTVDNGQDFTGLTLTVTNLADGADEVLTIDGSDVALTDGTMVTTANNSLLVSVSVSGSTATVSFTGATLTEAQMNTLVDGLTYRNDNDAPSTGANRVVTITNITDSGTSNNSAALSLTSTVTVVPVNDPPVVGNAYTETSTISQGGLMNLDHLDDATVADPDSGDFSGGLLTLAQSSGTANGAWGVDGTVATSGGDGTISAGETVQINGVTIGTVDVTDDGQGGNNLTIDFTTADATAANVALLLQNLTYAAPSGQGDRDFLVTLNDGDGTANGGDETDNGDFTIAVRSLPPVIDNLDGDSVTAEVSEIVLIDAGRDALITDADAPDAPLGHVLITPTSGLAGDFGVIGGDLPLQMGDVGASIPLIIGTQDTEISAGENIWVSPSNGSLSLIGDVSATEDGQNGAALRIDFADDPITNEYDVLSLLLQGLTFSSDQVGIHTFDLTITDSDSDFAATSVPVSFSVEILPPNEPPTVSITTLLDELPEDTDTSARIKLADVVIADDARGDNLLTLRGADSGAFELDGTELFLRAGAALDFEGEAELDVFVDVDDPTLGTGREDRAAFTLNLTDVNEPPSVLARNVIGSLPEDSDTTVDIKIADLEIRDDALGTNVLSLSGADAGLFTIVGTELFLAAGAALDFETQLSLAVSVAVDDPAVGGTPDDSVDLVLSITDVNEAPSLSLINLNLGLEETGFLLGRVKVADVVITDDALGDEILSLEGPNRFLFQLDGTELYVRAGQPLDFEMQHPFEVTIAVDDPSIGSGPEATIIAALPLLDVNEAPSLSLLNVLPSLAEDVNTTTRTKVADIVVTDDALGANTLALAGADAGLFEIDGTELFLSAGVALDFESDPQLDVTVTLDDAQFAGLEGSEALALAIVDVNEPPTVALLNVLAGLAEDTETSARIKVAEIDVTDDALGAATLGLAGDDASLFEIDGTDLFLSAGAALDFETNPSLDVQVTVDDPALAADPDDNAAMSVSVTDVNEAPSLALASVLAGLPEDTDTTTRTKVADIVVTDDALGANTLALAGADAGLFEIDGTELFLSAGVALDFESDPQLDVTVTLDDAQFAGLEGSEALALAIVDVNEPPTVALLNVLAGLAEDTETSARIKVAEIDVTDDALGAATLGLAGDDASLFEIDGTDLFLSAGAALDFETNPSLDVQVTVDDPALAADPDDNAAMSVSVTDVNEAPSVTLTGTIDTLLEQTDTSTRLRVATIMVTDDALGSNSLTLSGDDAALFEIDGDDLFLKAGTVLEHAGNPQLDVAVSVDDPDVGTFPDDTVVLSIAVPDTKQTGTPGNDLLIGDPLLNLLEGLGGDDTLVGLAEDDTLDGGPGMDTAVLQAGQENYTIVFSADGTTVSDRRPDGTGSDTLIDIERLRFSEDPEGSPDSGNLLNLEAFDGVLDVTADQLESLTMLYLALYDRAPDALGLFYWSTQLANGMRFSDITEEFLISDEAIALFGGTPSNADIVSGAYENLLDRAPDASGETFWTGLLELGLINTANFYRLFVQGVENNLGADGDRSTLADQTDIGLYYAVIQGLSDSTDAATAMNFYDTTDRANSLQEAKDFVDDIITDSQNGTNPQLLVQLNGVVDDPFGIA
jgi:Domain of unknown function (DUF4214)